MNPKIKVELKLVTIPAGIFDMGGDDNPNERPIHKVDLSEYQIGKYPVTVYEYKKFIDDDGYAKRKFWESGGFGQFYKPCDWDEQLLQLNHPVIDISWYEASAYAKWANCRLPTEAEWEMAARGTGGREYPWGNEKPNRHLANFNGEVGTTTPVNFYPKGTTKDGIFDMAGNVWEWCEDVWHENYKGAPTDGSAWTTGGNQEYRVVRGGAWYDYSDYLRSAYRTGYVPANRSGDVGFRVAAGTTLLTRQMGSENIEKILREKRDAIFKSMW